MLLRAAALALLLATTVQAQEALTYQTPAPELAVLVDAPRTPGVSLSPDRTTMAFLTRPGAPPITELAEPELGLAGVRINPRTTGPSRASGFASVSFRAVEGGPERPLVGVPADAHIRSVDWSPDGRHAAMLVDFRDRVELWTADVATGQARRAFAGAVNDAAPGASFAWLPSSDALVVRAVPATSRPPRRSRTPRRPARSSSRATAAPRPARTYQDLLESALDEALFDHYMTSGLAVVGLDGSVRGVGSDEVYVSMAPSPDGRFLMTEALHRPYSYLVPWYRFPRRTQVWDLATGAAVHTVADTDLAERVPIAFGSVPTGPRSFEWRADAPATVVWAEAQDGGDAGAQAAIRDRLYALAAPFSGAPVELAAFPLRYGGVTWGDGQTALAYDSQWQTRQVNAYRLRPGPPRRRARDRPVLLVRGPVRQPRFAHDRPQRGRLPRPEDGRRRRVPDGPGRVGRGEPPVRPPPHPRERPDDRAVPVPGPVLRAPRRLPGRRRPADPARDRDGPAELRRPHP